MTPRTVGRIFATPYTMCATHVANVIRTTVSDDWNEIPQYSIEVQRRGYPVISLLVEEQSFGTDRVTAIARACTLVRLIAQADHTVRREQAA